MSRKDYRILADALLSARNEARDGVQIAMCDVCVEYVADALQRDNPRFDRDKFNRAAGMVVANSHIITRSPVA